MEIKTIRWQLDHSEKFDTAVNAELAEGWQLQKREVLVPPTNDKHIMLYAELVKHDAPQTEEKNPIELLKEVKAYCAKCGSCGDCALQGWCSGDLLHGRDPSDWELDNYDTAGA